MSIQLKTYEGGIKELNKLLEIKDSEINELKTKLHDFEINHKLLQTSTKLIKKNFKEYRKTSRGKQKELLELADT